MADMRAAMEERARRRYPNEDWDEIDEATRRLWRTLVVNDFCAFLAAIAEPSARMKDAGDEEVGAGQPPEAYWRAMHAALVAEVEECVK